MEELMKNLLELKHFKSVIESEIEIATPNPKTISSIFQCRWNWRKEIISVGLSEKRSLKHRANKLKLAKDFLKLIDDEIKENEQKLKKLLK